MKHINVNGQGNTHSLLCWWDLSPFQVVHYDVFTSHANVFVGMANSDFTIYAYMLFLWN